jgi:hypothetical protein
MAHHPSDFVIQVKERCDKAAHDAMRWSGTLGMARGSHGRLGSHPQIFVKHRENHGKPQV